jgi:hypothetical protein
MDYGFKIEASSIDERKQTIMGLLQASIDPTGGQGKPGNSPYQKQ